MDQLIRLNYGGKECYENRCSNKIDSRDLKGLIDFCKKYKTQGIVVTKDVLKEDEEEGITYVPAWLFLSVI